MGGDGGVVSEDLVAVYRFLGRAVEQKQGIIQPKNPKLEPSNAFPFFIPFELHLLLPDIGIVLLFLPTPSFMASTGED